MQEVARQALFWSGPRSVNKNNSRLATQNGQLVASFSNTPILLLGSFIFRSTPAKLQNSAWLTLKEENEYYLANFIKLCHNTEMEIRIVKDRISLDELKALAHKQYGDIIKAVVDVSTGIMGVGGEFHSEIEALLMEKEGAERENTWGINLALNETGDSFIEFDSMVNLKPLLGNKSRGVENPEVRKKIKTIVDRLVIK